MYQNSMQKNIIFDFKSTLYNPEQERLMAQTKKILTQLKNKKYSLVLISMDTPDIKKIINSLGITQFFNQIVITNKKTEKLLKKFIKKEPIENYIVGDRIKKEITIGNQLNYTTIWLKKGKFSNELPSNNIEKPDYIINELIEILKIIN